MAIHRQVIKQSFFLVIRHKFLWFFGFFAAIAGIGGEFGFTAQAFEKMNQGTFFPTLRDVLSTGIFSLNGFKMMGKIFTVDPFSSFFILFIAVVIITIIIFVIWLVVVSQAALVNHVTQVEKKGRVNMQTGFAMGIKNFGVLFCINFLAKAIIFLIFFLFLLPLFFLSADNNTPINDLYWIITFIIFIPIAFIISFLAKYAVAYVVLKKEHLWSSLEKGWQLFLRNWLISLEMAFLVFAITILVGLALFVVAFLISVPFLVLISFAIAIQSTALFWFFTALLIICELIALILVFAILGAFQWSCWTMLFNRLTNKGALARLQRWGNALKNITLTPKKK